MRRSNCLERTQNHLTGEIVNKVMADQSLNEVDKILRMAIISCFGVDAPAKIAARAMLIGGVIASTAKDLEKSLEGSL